MSETTHVYKNGRDLGLGPIIMDFDVLKVGRRPERVVVPVQLA